MVKSKFPVDYQSLQKNTGQNSWFRILQLFLFHFLWCGALQKMQCCMEHCKMLRHLKNIGKCKKAGTINMFLPHNVSPILGVYKLYFNRERDDDVTAAVPGSKHEAMWFLICFKTPLFTFFCRPLVETDRCQHQDPWAWLADCIHSSPPDLHWPSNRKYLSCFQRSATLEGDCCVLRWLSGCAGQ